MTFGSMMKWGGFGKSPTMSPIERYHSGSGGGYWEHKSHGHGHKSGGKGGSSAALSALALLAFLFLINVMQQSLQDNNSTTTPVPGTTALLLREESQPMSLNAHKKTLDEEDEDEKNFRDRRTSASPNVAKTNPKKGDTTRRGIATITFT